VIVGLVGSSLISKALEAEIVSSLQQLGSLLIARLLQNICGLRGEERLPNVMNIFSHLLKIKGISGLLVNHWLPEAALELQNGATHFGCLRGRVKLCSAVSPTEQGIEIGSKDRGTGIRCGYRFFTGGSLATCS
jgi:hypothetical protein